MIVIVVWYRPLVFVSGLIGAVSPVTTLFIFAILFLLVLSIHFSLIISRLSQQVKDLVQEVAILKSETKNTMDD